MQLALLYEAHEHLRCILDEYEDLATRYERCQREVWLLSVGVGKALDRTYDPARADWDEAHLLKHATRVLSHPRVGEALRRVTDDYDALCKRWLDLEPGQHPGPTHELNSIDASLHFNPLCKLILRLLLQLPPEPGYPLGRPTRRRSVRWSKRVRRLRARKVVKLGKIAGKRRRRERRRPVAQVRGPSHASAAQAAAAGSDSDAPVDAQPDVVVVRSLDRVVRPEVEPVPAGEGGRDARGSDDEDRDATPPTAPVDEGGGAMHVDPAPPPAQVERCQYCHSAEGDLWWCQRCGDHTTHLSCCAKFVRLSFAEHDDLEALCSVCARKCQAERVDDRAELETALADVVNEESLLQRLDALEHEARPAVLLQLRASLRFLGGRASGVPDQSISVKLGYVAAQADTLRICELLGAGDVSGADEVCSRLGGRLRRAASLRRDMRELVFGDDASLDQIERAYSDLERIAKRCVHEPLVFAKRCAAAAAATARAAAETGGEEDADSGDGPQLPPPDLTKLRKMLTDGRKALVDEVDESAFRFVGEHLAKPESGLGLPASLLRRTLEMRGVRRAEEPRSRPRPRHDSDGDGDGDESDGDGVDGGGRRHGPPGPLGEPRQCRERDLLRRQVRRLSGMRSVGNQQAMSNAKMLERLLAYFGREPRVARKRRSRLDLGPSVGAEEVWLDAQALLRLSPAYLWEFRERMKGFFEIISSDNATYFHHSGFGLTHELVHWTAWGSAFVRPEAGSSRRAPHHALACGVASWVVPTSAADDEWRYASAVERRRGAPVMFPLDVGLQLPGGWVEFARVRDLFVSFDGTMHDAMAKLDGYLNFSDKIPTILTNVPEARSCTRWLKETRRQFRVVAWRRHHALDDVSGPVQQPRPTVVLQRTDTGIEEVEVGLRTHSQQVYPQQWNADLTDIVPCDLRPAPPLPLNSLSKADALLLYLRLVENAVDQEPYAWYNKLPGGDGNRPFFQRDGASENISLGVLETTVQRVWRASLVPTDAAYARHHKPFQSVEEAKNWVTAAAKLLVIDPLPAPLHNSMIIAKSIGVPHELVASFGSCRIRAKLPLLVCVHTASAEPRSPCVPWSHTASPPPPPAAGGTRRAASFGPRSASSAS